MDDNGAYETRFEAVLTRNGFGSEYQNSSGSFQRALQLIESSIKGDSFRAVDIGCAYGFTTKRLLDDPRSQVIANDLCTQHLSELWTSLTPEKQQRLTLSGENFLDMKLDPNSVDCLFALRVFHFLSGDQIRQAFAKFAQWLKPNGIVLITCSSPFRSTLSRTLLAKFESERDKTDWPGDIWVKDFCSDELYLRNVRNRMNFIVPDQLIRESIRVDLRILEAGYENRPSKTNESPTKEYSYLIAQNEGI